MKEETLRHSACILRVAGSAALLVPCADLFKLTFFTMAEKQQEFRYRRIELYKSKSLGSGSYGGVCRAKCDGLPCAAKIMHPTLFDLRDPGTASYLERFEGECRLLSLARHPNIVQYLATYRDPETRLPVLLMEMCDESLSRFLERSPGPLPYHIEVNISHDITLALVYLHSNGLIHRDLTGNNVLMIAGVHAKVTDFGMSKLARVNPRATPMTLCPGNLQYMSPEALEEPPSYTEKLDIFSFGVLLVQIMTRQFPDAGPRFQVLELSNDPRFPEGTARVPIPEAQRRSAHLNLISGTHPLKAIALNCLKSKEKERPSAQQLSNSLSELKGAPQYAESKQQSQTDNGDEQEVSILRRQVRDLQQQQQEQIQKIKEQHQTNEQHEANGGFRQEIEHLQQQDQRQRQHIQQQRQEIEQAHLSHQQTVAQLEQQLNEQRVLTEAKRREVQQLQCTVEDKERELQQMKILAATSSVVKKDITQLRLERGRKAPEGMVRGAAVVDGDTVYINPDVSHKIYSFQITSEYQQWSTLPISHYNYFSLAVIDGLLTSIGGRSGGREGSRTNSLLSLTGERRERQWSKVFPPMPTARKSPASITTRHSLVVAGGNDGSKCLDTVEVMNISTKQWSTARHMPHPFSWISATVCGDQLYVGGGYGEGGKPSKSVLTCSLPDLLRPQSLGTKLRTLFLTNEPGIWRHTKELPVTRSTLTTLGGHLVAVGGADDSNNPTTDVRDYDPRTGSWHVVKGMKTKRFFSLVAVLPEDRPLIVGGCDASWQSTDSVEIGSFPVRHITQSVGFLQ